MWVWHSISCLCAVCMEMDKNFGIYGMRSDAVRFEAEGLVIE